MKAIREENVYMVVISVLAHRLLRIAKGENVLSQWRNCKFLTLTKGLNLASTDSESTWN